MSPRCEPEHRCFPSGLDATQVTCPLWSGTAATSFKVDTSHSLSDKSTEPVTICFPSQENARDVTEPPCPCRRPVSMPVSESQMATVMS